MLLPDRDELARFVAALFCHADLDTFLSMRTFFDHKDGSALHESWLTARVTGNIDDIVDAAEDLAGIAAYEDEAIVFAPPITTFTNRDKADEASVANGLVISAELDSNPATGLEFVEAVIGPATVVMESGGLWLDEATGELVPKLHAHWRLAAPTRLRIEHDLLKEANRLATTLAGGDPSAVPFVHPLRWAGSVHRKAEPRLARIIQYRPEVEITLAEALTKLRAAATAAGKGNGHDPAQAKFTGSPQAELVDIAVAVAVIPNDDSDEPKGTSWKLWDDMGLRIHAATGGSDWGLVIWMEWSRRSTKKFNEDNTRKTWAQLRPTRTGAGALFKRHAKRTRCSKNLRITAYAPPSARWTAAALPRRSRAGRHSRHSATRGPSPNRPSGRPIRCLCMSMT
jgi:hypothetical protein